MNNDFKYNIFIVFISIIINFVLSLIVLSCKIPFLFLDSVGTILTAVILGPIYGAIVGILTNLILSLSISYSHLYFTIINALIGLIVGLISRKFKFNIYSAVIIGIIIGLISPIIGTPISIILTEGFSGGTIDSFIDAMIQSGVNIIEASFIMRVLANIFDKVLSCIIIYIAITKVTFLQRYMNITNNDNIES